MVEYKFKKILCFVLALLMLLSMSACTTFNNFKTAFLDKTDEEVKVIKIGVLEPQTGADASAAADEIIGIELAHSMYEYVNDAKIELVYADNQSDVSLCNVAAQSLIDAGVSVILGSYNSVLTLASSDLIREAEIPSIAITNTNPIITSTNRYYFRACYIDSFEGDVAADFVLNQLNTTNTAVFYKDTSDYASAMAAEFTSAVEEATGEYDCVPAVIYPAETVDFGPIFLNLKILSPEAIFFPGSLADAQPVIEAAQIQGYDFTWVGTKRWDGIETEGVYYTLDYDPESPDNITAAKLNVAYKEKYGKDVPSEAIALGFDAYLIALDGLRRAEDVDNAENVVVSIETVNGLLGATGELTMSSSGDPIKEVLVEKVENGERQKVYVALPQKEGREEVETEEE